MSKAGTSGQDARASSGEKGAHAANPFDMFDPFKAAETFAAAASASPMQPPAGAEAMNMAPEDAQKLLQNMTLLFEQGRGAWETMMASAQKGQTELPDLDPFHTSEAFTEWWMSLAQDPTAMAEKTLKFWSDQAEIWRRAMLKASGQEAEPVAASPAGDKRFKDAEWSQNAVFDAIKQSYFLTSGFLTDAAKSGGALSAKERKKVEFFTKQFVDAISPSNYFATNPEVLRTTIEEKGDNLVRGLKHMLEDLQRGKGTLLIRQTDMDKFKVGENTAATPGKVIYRNDLMELIQYAPSTKKVEARPVLFIPPWINKFYILDLNEKKSMVKWLVDQGHTVFLVSWVNPTAEHQDKEWVDYIAEGLFEATARVLDETGADKINLAAYCVGGSMTCTGLAYLAQQPEHPLSGRIANVTYFTSQFEFSDAGDLQLFTDEQQVAALESLTENGLLGAEKMVSAFNMLRSSDLIWGFVVNNYLLGKEPFPFDMLYWNSDATRLPARVHGYYLQNYYVDNKLAKGELQLGEVQLDMGEIDLPSYHVAAKEDHIAPAASVYRGVRLTGGDRRVVIGGSGHIAGIINPPVLEKYQYWVRDDGAFPETLEEWREGATERPGSWWVDWDAWLKAQNEGMDQVPARKPGARSEVLCDAPGTYVRARFDDSAE